MNDWPGVYLIINKRNNKVYVGCAAKGLRNRFKAHRRDLLRNKSHNRHLQNAWNKYGSKWFVFAILERCPISDCVARETYWIAYYKATNRKFGYNICEVGSNCFGVKRSEATKQKHRGFKPSKSHLATLIESNKSRVWGEESLRKKSEATKRLWNNHEWRAKQVAARVGKKHSKETAAKIASSNRGQKRSPEIRARMGLAAKKRIADNPELLKAMIDRCRKMASGACKARWRKYKIAALINAE